MFQGKIFEKLLRIKPRQLIRKTYNEYFKPTYSLKPVNDTGTVVVVHFSPSHIFLRPEFF